MKPDCVTFANFRFQATDADTGSNGDVSYKLETGGEDELFYVESKTGHVTTAALLSDKEGTKYVLTITAQDDATPARSSKVSATVDVSNSYMTEALSALMLCAPNNRPSAAIFVSYENGGLRVFSCFVRFLVKQIDTNSEKSIEYGK